VAIGSLLKNLNGEHKFCLYSELGRKYRTVQVAEIGSEQPNMPLT